MKQLHLLKPQSKSYGGELLKTRKGRSTPRPLDTRGTMHLVLRSSKAQGAWSFRNPKNAPKIQAIVDRFSKKYGVRVIQLANVGNHLHFHLKLSNRHTYPAFIRALTGAIAMAVTGASRWKPLTSDGSVTNPGDTNPGDTNSSGTSSKSKTRFWDYRPFTRVLRGRRAFLSLHDYIEINQLEGLGATRLEARTLVRQSRRIWPPPRSRPQS